MYSDKELYFYYCCYCYYCHCYCYYITVINYFQGSKKLVRKISQEQTPIWVVERNSHAKEPHKNSESMSVHCCYCCCCYKYLDRKLVFFSQVIATLSTTTYLSKLICVTRGTLKVGWLIDVLRHFQYK